jgi:multiple sugar transport system substrate-binding protein
MKNTPRRRQLGVMIAALVAVAALLTACTSGGGTSSAGTGKGTISVWSYQGTDAEVAVLKQSVADYNSSQSKVKVNLRFLPADTYTTTITNTPADQLPDVLDMDGPTMSSFAYNGKLANLTTYLSPVTIENATGGSVAEGTYDGTLYALAQFDSAMGFYGNKKLLDAAGVKYPTTVDTAWTPDEFLAALKALAASNASGKALDIAESGLAGEWSTYAFAPLIWSAGGNLMAGGKAKGVLDSPATVKALTEFATWKPYVDPSADGKAFSEGRVAIGVGGHWNYPDYSKALGSDLLVLPLPNMGDGAKSGAGSWTWGIGSSTKNGKASGAFLDYLLGDKSVTAMTNANGSPPATKTVAAADPLYKTGGPLELWGQQLAHACAADAITSDCVAVYRPTTPGYPTVSAKFAGAVTAIWGGADAQSSLTDAAKSIDQNFSDNNGYK